MEPARHFQAPSDVEWIPQDITAFFESYRLAFHRLDATAIAEHFAFPLHVTGEGREVSTTSVQAQGAWTEQIHRLLGMYRGIGFVDATFRLLGHVSLSHRLASVHVQWTLHDGAGDPLYTFCAIYTLVRIEVGLRITAIAQNDIPQYLSCLQRSGAAVHPTQA